LAWLLNSVSRDLQPSIVYFKIARDVWIDLQYRYGQDNGPRIFELRKEISSLTQENLTINAYYTKFKGLWVEFSNYRTCTCGHQVEECIMSFLMGLNETYAAVRGQILLMDPVPPLSKVFSLIIQDENQRKVGAAKKMQLDIAIALASTLAAKNVKKGRSQCIHCGAMGHVVDKCFKLHGYPPGYKFKFAKGQAAAALLPFANNVIAFEDDASEGVSLTKSNYQELLGLLNSNCHFGTQGPSEGVVDTHQVANIITQPSFDLQEHEISSIWSVPSL